MKLKADHDQKTHTLTVTRGRKTTSELSSSSIFSFKNPTAFPLTSADGSELAPRIQTFICSLLPSSPGLILLITKQQQN